MYKNKQKYKIWDTTLRDGEQMPGVVFSPEEKIELATKFSDFGVDVIELMPAVSESEKRLAKQLASQGLGAEITASTMLRKEHVEIVLDCGIESITLFTPLSDIHLKYKLGISREENLERALEMVDFAGDHGLRVVFAGEDSTRADIEYLVNFINELSKHIEYFIPCDTLGCLTPSRTSRFFNLLNERCDFPLGSHVHNDFGMATANTLAGLMAGAEIFSGTFGGIGERAGNASIEEVCTALKFLHDVDLDVRYDMLTEICRLVEQYSGIVLQHHKPIVGRNAFSHESGIHVDGILKNPATYENFDPGFVGQERRLLFGKHTGRGIIKHIINKYKINWGVEEALEKIKYISEHEHRSLRESEIASFFDSSDASPPINDLGNGHSKPTAQDV